MTCNTGRALDLARQPQQLSDSHGLWCRDGSLPSLFDDVKEKMEMNRFHLRSRSLAVLLAGTLAVAAATFFLLLPAASPAVNTKLFAYDNEPNEPYFGIWLKDANGALVTHLAPARTRSMSTTGQLKAAFISRGRASTLPPESTRSCTRLGR
jgi:hypothetical protein